MHGITGPTADLGRFIPRIVWPRFRRARLFSFFVRVWTLLPRGLRSTVLSRIGRLFAFPGNNRLPPQALLISFRTLRLSLAHTRQLPSRRLLSETPHPPTVLLRIILIQQGHPFPRGLFLLLLKISPLPPVPLYLPLETKSRLPT